MAQLVLGAAGAAVGFFVGGPVGAQIGWALGSLAGAALTPNAKAEGPRLTDKRIQGSSYGWMIPMIDGNMRTAGNVIDRSPEYNETSHTETQGGKGGGTDVTTYTVSASYDIMVCEGSIAGIRKAWADGRLMFDDSVIRDSPTSSDNPNPIDWQTFLPADWHYYVGHPAVWSKIDATPLGARQKINEYSQGGASYDPDAQNDPYTGVLVGGPGLHEASEDLPELPWTIYLGSQDQLPDPTFEAIHGVGKVPAYRGRAHIVFTDHELGDFGNRIPQWEFEVIEHGDDIGFHRDAYVAEEPVVFASDVVTWSDGFPVFISVQGGVARVRIKGTETIRLYDADTLEYISEGVYDPVTDEASGEVDYAVINTGSSEFEFYFSCDNTISGTLSITSNYGTEPIGSPDDYGNPFSKILIGTTHFLDGLLPLGKYITGAFISADRTHVLVILGDTNIRWDDWVLIKAEDFSKVDEGTCDVVDPFYHVISNSGNHQAPGWAGMMENNLTRIWTADAQIQYYEINTATKVLSLVGEMVSIVADPDNGWPLLPYPSIFVKEGEAWVIGGEEMVRYSIGGLVASPPTLASVVTKYSLKAGLTVDEIDVTELENDYVQGCIINRQMTCRSIIEIFQPVYYFDVVESDGKIKYVKRGKASAVTIDEDDLAASDSDELPALLTTQRIQEVELPSIMNVVYMNPDAAYQINTQSARRMTGGSQEAVTIELPMVLSDSKAKELAQVHLFNPWLEREVHQFSTSRKFEMYEPTDVMRVNGRNLRVTQKTDGANGVVTFNAVRTLGIFGGDPVEGDTIFEQGATDPGTAGGFITPVVNPVQRTVAMLLDMPLIVNADDGAGFYVAMGASSDLTTWPGAKLFQSVDGGVTYSEILSVTDDDAMGVAMSTLGNYYGGNTFDELNYVDVLIDAGASSLSSTSTTNVLNGMNAAMLGSELIQYRTATLIATRTYRLSGLLRGRKGTEWAMSTHTVGERFVALTLLDRVTSTVLNVERQYKAVSFGRSLASTDEIEFTNTGISQKPYAPTHVGGGRDASNNITINWGRRSRLTGTAWMDPPLGETTESWQIDIMSGVTVKRTLTATTNTVAYSAANQTTDGFTPGVSPIVVNVYQMSATVGRGYAGVGTI